MIRPLLTRTSCLLALAVAFAPTLPVPAFAQDSTSATVASSPDQAQATPAGKFVQDLGNHAIAIIADKSLTPQQHADQYRVLLHNAFDLKTIGHFVIGRAYNAAPVEQQQEYQKLFEDLVVKIYGDRLNFYSGENFHVKSVRQESGEDMIVGSEIDHPGGESPTLIDWRVRQANGKLAIIDVIIAGISQSVTQRQEYTSIIQRDGGKLDGLLDAMRKQLQQNSSSN